MLSFSANSVGASPSSSKTPFAKMIFFSAKCSVNTAQYIFLSKSCFVSFRSVDINKAKLYRGTHGAYSLVQFTKQARPKKMDLISTVFAIVKLNC